MKRPYVLYILLCITIITRLALAFRPATQLSERLYQEDAFYALDCANHLAHGDGLTVDGVHATNGVQPLIVFLYSVCFFIAGSDSWLGVRLTFIVVALLESLCVVLMYKLVNQFKKPDVNYSIDPALIGAFAWTFIFSNLIHNAIGLETGLYAMMILLCLYLYNRIIVREKKNEDVHYGSWGLLGCALGFLVLARIDGIFLLGGISIVDILRRKKDTFTKRIFPSIIVCAVALIISSPWWIYNYTMFGSLMPISGQSEALGAFISQNIHFSITQIANISFVLFYLPTDFPPGDLTLLIASLVLLGMSLAWMKTKLLHWLQVSYELTALYSLVVAGLFIFLYYTFLFAAPHFIGRYFHPIRMLMLISSVLIFPEVWQRWKRWNWKNPLKYTVALFFICGIAFNSLHYIRNFTITETSLLYWDGVWASKHPQYKIGLTSSGTAGFMSDNIVNLDGKVNVDALRARKAHRIGKYVIESGINVLTGLDQFIIDDLKQQGIVVTPIDSFQGEGFFLLKR